MKANPGWIHAHRRIVIVALVVCVFASVFFLAPVIRVYMVGCMTDWQSPGYYLYKIGYHVVTAGPYGCL